MGLTGPGPSSGAESVRCEGAGAPGSGNGREGAGQTGGGGRVGSRGRQDLGSDRVVGATGGGEAKGVGGITDGKITRNGRGSRVREPGSQEPTFP